jgi:hypothetical protein
MEEAYMTEKLRELSNLGQSIWYDNIRRAMLTNGEFEELIASGVLGVTSNPTIFEKAIAGSADYDTALKEPMGWMASSALRYAPPWPMIQKARS